MPETMNCLFTSSESNNTSDRESQKPRAREWKPTILRIGPLSGIFAMFLAIVTLAIDAAILIASDGASVDSWSAGPSIYLAICTAIANLAMRYACLHGVVITWWSRAIGGSTLKKLHQDWKAGSSLYGAITSGRRIGLLGIATVFSTIVIVDGPLLQRSTTVQLAPILEHPIPLGLRVSPELPHGYGGLWATAEENGAETLNSPVFNKSIPAGDGGTVSNDVWPTVGGNNLDLERSWAENEPLSIITGCAGKCRATIRAPALAKTACTHHEIAIDFNKAGPLPPGHAAAPVDQNAFLVTISLVVAGASEKINVITGYSTTTHCAGILNLTACTLESAIGEYQVSVSENKTTLIDPSGPRIVALANNTAVSHRITKQSYGVHKSTLAATVSMASAQVGCLMQVLSLNGTLQVAYLGYNKAVQWIVQDKTAVESHNGACETYRDPLSDIMASLNTAMVYNGAFAAKASRDDLRGNLDPDLLDSVNTTVIGQVIGQHNVFHSNYWWFFGAVVVELVCILTLIPTYWGWWRLGRGFSFSPLEIAQAFEAPLLAHCDTNASGRSLANAAPNVRVRYGEVRSRVDNDSTGGERLAFGTESEVCEPQRSTYWNNVIVSSSPTQASMKGEDDEKLTSVH